MSGRQLNETELARFHQLLSHLVRSQVPLPEALHQLSRDLDGWTSQAATNVARSLEEGQSLSAALAAHGGFPALYLELVAAGEQSGDLGQVLAYLAQNEGINQTGLADLLEVEAVTLGRIVDQDPDSLLEADPKLPAEMQRIIKKSLAKEPAKVLEKVLEKASEKERARV